MHSKILKEKSKIINHKSGVNGEVSMTGNTRQDVVTKRHYVCVYIPHVSVTLLVYMTGGMLFRSLEKCIYLHIAIH